MTGSNLGCFEAKPLQMQVLCLWMFNLFVVYGELPEPRFQMSVLD